MPPVFVLEIVEKLEQRFHLLTEHVEIDEVPSAAASGHRLDFHPSDIPQAGDVDAEIVDRLIKQRIEVKRTQEPRAAQRVQMAREVFWKDFDKHRMSSGGRSRMCDQKTALRLGTSWGTLRPQGLSVGRACLGAGLARSHRIREGRHTHSRQGVGDELLPGERSDAGRQRSG